MIIIAPFFLWHPVKKLTFPGRGFEKRCYFPILQYASLISTVMKVFKIEQDPSAEEIVLALRQEFSSKYSYSFFGVGENKTIIVKRSELIGAQISKSGDRITVHAMPPNLLLSSLDAVLTGLVSAVSYSALIKLEKDLVVFLKGKYSV